MLSGLHNIGLGTLSGYAEGDIMLKADTTQMTNSYQNLQACVQWLNWRKTWLEEKGMTLPDSQKAELSNLQSLDQQWTESNAPLSVTTAKQWNGWVNGVDGAVIAEQYVVKSALQKAMSNNFINWESQISALSGFIGSLNGDRYVAVPGPTMYEDQGTWHINPNNTGRVEVNTALSTFMQYNRPGRLSSELSGIAPFFELNPWLAMNDGTVPNMPFQFPYGVADKIARMNEPLATPVYDLSGELSVVGTYQAPVMLSNHKIGTRTFQTSAWVYERQIPRGDMSAWAWPYYYQYEIDPLQIGGVWWLGGASWTSLAGLSARYTSANPVWANVAILSAGTDLPFSISSLFYKPGKYPMNITLDTVYDLTAVEGDWAPINFTYGSDYMRIWTQPLLADLTEAAHVTGDSHANDGQSIRALERALNNCCVLGRQLNPGTPLIQSTAGGWTISVNYDPNPYSDTWTGGLQTLQLNRFIPYGGPQPEACAAQHKYAQMMTVRYLDNDVPNKEYTESYCYGGSIVSSEVSSVVWDFGLDNAVLSTQADPQVWYCMNFISRLGSCETWNDEGEGGTPKIGFSGMNGQAPGFRMSINVGFVRADTVRAKRENGQLVADPNGNLLVAFQGLNFMKDANNMAQSLFNGMGNLPICPFVPNWANVWDDDEMLSWRGIAFKQVEFMPPYFCAVWIPWANRFKFVVASRTRWPMEVQAGG